MDELPEDNRDEILRVIGNLPLGLPMADQMNLVASLRNRPIKDLRQAIYWIASGVPAKSIMLRLGITTGTPIEQIQQVCEAIEERKERDANS